MNRISIACLALIVLSAISLVSAQYRSRQLFIDIETAKGVEHKLDTQWRVLQLEQTTYSKHSLIESAAVRALHMVPATAKRMRYLALPSRIASAPKLPSTPAPSDSPNP